MAPSASLEISWEGDKETEWGRHVYNHCRHLTKPWLVADSDTQFTNTSQSAVIKDKRGTTVDTSSPCESECVTNMCLWVCLPASLHLTSILTLVCAMIPPNTCITLHSFALSTLMPQVFSHLVLQWSVHSERFATFLSPLWTPSSIYSSSCSRFLFIPAMPLHPVMFCFQATDRTVSPPLLLYSPLSSLPYALCSTAAFTARAVSLASPIEVSALPRCQIRKEFWHDCVPLYTLWHMQMAWNGPGWAKQEEHE